MQIFIFSLLLLLSSAAFAKKDVLVFGKNIRPAHAQIIYPAMQAMQKMYLKSGISSEIHTDPSIFNFKNLEEVAAIVLLDTTESVLSDENKVAIENFVKSGGTLLAIHGTIAAGRDWVWLRNAIGTSFVDHPPMQTGTVQVVDPETSKSLPGKWEQFDEWYNFSNPLSAEFSILMKVDEHTYSGGKMGDHPITWWRRESKGRVWYTAMGHALSLYENHETQFSRLLLETSVWATNR